MTNVNSGNEFLPYNVENKHLMLDAWVNESKLSLTRPHEVELTDTYPVTDNVNKPNHYQGKYGMESVEVIDNFIGDLVGKAAWCWGNAIKYLLRFQNKNGLEDLKKARKNLDWLIEEMEREDE